MGLESTSLSDSGSCALDHPRSPCISLKPGLCALSPKYQGDGEEIRVGFPAHWWLGNCPGAGQAQWKGKAGSIDGFGLLNGWVMTHCPEMISSPSPAPVPSCGCPWVSLVTVFLFSSSESSLINLICTCERETALDPFNMLGLHPSSFASWVWPTEVSPVPCLPPSPSSALPPGKFSLSRQMVILAVAFKS